MKDPLQDQDEPKRRYRKNQEKEIDILYLDDCFKLSRWSASLLEWRERPRYHFESTREHRRWNARWARRRAGSPIKTKLAGGGCRTTYLVRLDRRNLVAHRVAQLLMDLEEDRRAGRKPPRQKARYHTMTDRIAERKLERRMRAVAAAG
jgi:hypothetical protein